MITIPVAIEEITAKILAVDLLPRFRDWRNRDKTAPDMGYRIRLRIRHGSDVLNGTFWVPTATSGDAVQTLGVESETPPIPKYDRHAARPKVTVDGHVAIDSDTGHPMLSPEETPDTSHWAICRFVPTRGGSALKLKGVTLTPTLVPEGPAKNSFAVDKQGIQSVSVSADDWECTLVTTKAADGEFRTVQSSRGAQVPAFASEG